MSTRQNGRAAPYPIGIIGAGRAFDSLAGLFFRKDFQDAFPHVSVVGVAEVNPNALHLDKARELGIPVYPDHAALFAEHPDLRMVLDLTGDESLSAALRQEAPAEACLIDRASSLLIWEFIASEELCAACRYDLEHSRTLLATIVDEMDEDVILLDLEGRVKQISTRAAEAVGLPPEQCVGQACAELHKDRLCAQNNGGCPAQVAAQEGRRAEATQTVVDENGHVRYFRVTAYPVHGESGQIHRIMEIRRDVTHSTDMEHRLQQTEKMAAIGELATYIAHEIRNPLFAIAGFANSLLRVPSLDESAREKVSIILDESKRLDNILKSTLNFARPTEAKEGVVDLNRIVRETMEVLGFACRDMGITVKLDLDEGIALGKGDPELVKQCLINLVKNAQEAMPGGGVLTIRTAMGEQYVVVEVRDTGTGIAKENLEKIFNPFFSTKDKGSGLGLAMIKKIMEEGGGRVSVDSEEDKGATIRLHVPPVLAVDGKDA